MLQKRTTLRKLLHNSGLSFREANWSLHLPGVRRTIPSFFVSDRINNTQ